MEPGFSQGAAISISASSTESPVIVKYSYYLAPYVLSVCLHPSLPHPSLPLSLPTYQCLYIILCLQVFGNSASNIGKSTTFSSASYNYSVKVCNPKRKRQFQVVQLRTKARFESLEDLKEQIVVDHGKRVCTPIHPFEPGHGLHGKLRFLVCNEDLNHSTPHIKRSHMRSHCGVMVHQKIEV